MSISASQSSSNIITHPRRGLAAPAGSAGLTRAGELCCMGASAGSLGGDVSLLEPLGVVWICSRGAGRSRSA